MRGLVLMCLLMVLLAGCSAPDVDEPLDDEGAPLNDDLVFSRCTGGQLLVVVRSDWAEEQLPPNETLVPNPQTAGLMTNTLLTYLECEDHVLGDESLGPVRIMSYAISVEPADNIQIFHTYVRDLIVDGSPRLVAHWSSSSERVREGEVVLDDDAEGAVRLSARAGTDVLAVESLRLGSYEGSTWPIDRVWHHDDGSHWSINGTREQGPRQVPYLLQASGYLEDALAPVQSGYITWITLEGRYAPYESP